MLKLSFSFRVARMSTAQAALVLQGQGSSGQTVRTQNVLAASSIANIVKSSLGPVGLDKMMVDDVGDVTITNDGATILQLLEVEHPAKVLVELAALQDEEVRDGVSSVTFYHGFSRVKTNICTVTAFPTAEGALYFRGLLSIRGSLVKVSIIPSTFLFWSEITSSLRSGKCIILNLLFNRPGSSRGCSTNTFVAEKLIN